MTRFLIASQIPAPIADQLRQIYEKTFGKSLPIRLLHLTFIPPFTTNNSRIILNTLSSLPRNDSQYIFGPPAIFPPQVLYLPLLPSEELEQTHHYLMAKLHNHIVIEDDHDFVPHITLNYHFDSKWSLYVPPTDTFTPEKPELLFEAEPKIWEPYST